MSKVLELREPRKDFTVVWKGNHWQLNIRIGRIESVHKYLPNELDQLKIRLLQSIGQ